MNENIEIPKGYVIVKDIDYKLYERYKKDFLSVNSKKGSPWQKYKYLLGFFEYLKREDPLTLVGMEEMYQMLDDDTRERYFTIDETLSEIDKLVSELSVEDLDDVIAYISLLKDVDDTEETE